MNTHLLAFLPYINSDLKRRERVHARTIFVLSHKIGEIRDSTANGRLGSRYPLAITNIFDAVKCNLMLSFVVNLERSFERRSRIMANLRSLDVDFEIFRAVDGALGEHRAFRQYDEADCIRYFGSPLLPAEVGCFASHYLLWQRCVGENRPIAIMEDDVELQPGFPEALRLAASQVDQYRFIRLAGLVERPYHVIRVFNGSRKLVRFLQGPQGCQCYCLSPDGAAALLAAAEQWVEPVDLFIDRFWVHGVASMALLPFEVLHSDMAVATSTIGSRQQKRTGINKLRREWYRMRDTIARQMYNIRN